MTINFEMTTRMVETHNKTTKTFHENYFWSENERENENKRRWKTMQLNTFLPERNVSLSMGWQETNSFSSFVFHSHKIQKHKSRNNHTKQQQKEQKGAIKSEKANPLKRQNKNIPRSQKHRRIRISNLKTTTRINIQWSSPRISTLHLPSRHWSF